MSNFGGKYCYVHLTVAKIPLCFYLFPSHFKVCAEESVEMSVVRCVACESNVFRQEKILLCNIKKKLLHRTLKM